MSRQPWLGPVAADAYPTQRILAGQGAKVPVGIADGTTDEQASEPFRTTSPGLKQQVSGLATLLISTLGLRVRPPDPRDVHGVAVDSTHDDEAHGHHPPATMGADRWLACLIQHAHLMHSPAVLAEQPLGESLVVDPGRVHGRIRRDARRGAQLGNPEGEFESSRFHSSGGLIRPRADVHPHE